MKKYPFWVIKSDAKRLLKGKWNPLILALFIPFLAYVAISLWLNRLLEQTPPTAKHQDYLLYLELSSLIACVVLQFLLVGIYENLKPSKEKASFFSVYAIALKKSWKMLPTIMLEFVLPFGIIYWLSSKEAHRFYDYLMFSVIDFQFYKVTLQFLAIVIGVISIYIRYSLLLVPAITAEHPEYGGFALIKESFRLTRGKRFYLFALSLSFVGWYVLGYMAFIIGMLGAELFRLTATYAYYRRLTSPDVPIYVQIK